MDSVSEKSKGKKKIGSTGRGISPSYTDLTLRRALRVGDIHYGDFKKKYQALTREHKDTLKKVFGYNISEKELRNSEKSFWQGIKFMRTLKLEESSEIVERALMGGHKIIAEGAQATLLDIRFGHYPFVTSSHTIAGGVGTGLGIPPSYIGSSIGVLKAYVTKVGEGPFPTELGGVRSRIWCRDKKLKDELLRFPAPDKNSTDEFEQGIALRKAGSEMGAVTGRLRRTGWIDLPLLKYAIRMNEARELVLTKLDVLNGFKEIKACVAYVINGKKTEKPPFDLSRENIKPVYKTFPTWKGKLSDYGKKLPKEALDYVKFLEKELGAPIIYVGTGPEEHHVVERYWK